MTVLLASGAEDFVLCTHPEWPFLKPSVLCYGYDDDTAELMYSMSLDIYGSPLTIAGSTNILLEEIKKKVANFFRDLRSVMKAAAEAYRKPLEDLPLLLAGMSGYLNALGLATVKVAEMRLGAA